MKKKHKPYYDPTGFFKKLEREVRHGKIRKSKKKAKLKVETFHFRKPSPKEAAEIRRGVKEMKSGKVKTVSSQDLIKHLKKL